MVATLGYMLQPPLYSVCLEPCLPDVWEDVMGYNLLFSKSSQKSLGKSQVPERAKEKADVTEAQPHSFSFLELRVLSENRGKKMSL